MKNKNTLKILMMYLFGIIILAALISKIGISDIIKTLSLVRFPYIILVLLIFTLVFILGSMGIGILLLPIKKINIKKMIKYYFISWTFGIITPGRVGDMAILYFLKKEGINLGKGLAIVIMDKIITFSLLFFFGSVSLFLFFPFKIAMELFLIFLGIGLFGIMALYTNFGRRLIKKRILRKYAVKFSGFSAINKEYLKNNKKIIFINIYLTIVRIILMSLTSYFLFLSLGVKINIVYVFLISAAVQILSMVPITINGLGIKELTQVYLYSQIGVTPEIALTKSIIDLILVYMYGFLIFIGFGRKIVPNKSSQLS